MDPGEAGFAAFVAGIALVIGLVWAFEALRRARLIEDTPTSRIRSAAQGYVELSGRVRLMAGDPVIAPLTRMPCVWWSYAIKRKRNEKNGSDWEVIESGRSDDLFLLDDGGTVEDQCIVDAEGAEVTPALDFTWYGNAARPDLGPKAGAGLLRAAFCQYRYEERMIPVGAPVYALGWFRTQRDERDPVEESSAVRELLRDWKNDAAMMKLFDTNKDGDVDGHEWEAARRAALIHVRKQALEQALNPDFHVLRRPPDARPFLISGRGERHATRSLRWQGGIAFTVAVFAAALLVHFARLL